LTGAGTLFGIPNWARVEVAASIASNKKTREGTRVLMAAPGTRVGVFTAVLPQHVVAVLYMPFEATWRTLREQAWRALPMRVGLTLVVLFVACLPIGASEPQQPAESPRACESPGNPDGPAIKSISVQGLNRMTEPAFLHALELASGDPYNLEHLQSRLDFLWTLGIFEEVDFEANTLASGDKALAFKVKELAMVHSITFDDTNVLDPEIALDRLDDLVLGTRTGRPQDSRKLQIAEQAVRDLLADCGYLDSSVKAEVTHLAGDMAAVHFKIDLGLDARNAGP
jgi:outer membrane protein assembly factor BamA